MSDEITEQFKELRERERKISDTLKRIGDGLMEARVSMALMGSQLDALNETMARANTALKAAGYCGSVSEDGSQVCTYDAGHQSRCSFDACPYRFPGYPQRRCVFLRGHAMRHIPRGA